MCFCSSPYPSYHNAASWFQILQGETVLNFTNYRFKSLCNHNSIHNHKTGHSLNNSWITGKNLNNFRATFSFVISVSLSLGICWWLFRIYSIRFLIKIIDSTWKSLFWKPVTLVVTKVFHLCRTQTFHCRVYISPIMYPDLSHINPINITTLFLTSILILSNLYSYRISRSTNTCNTVFMFVPCVNDD